MLNVTKMKGRSGNAVLSALFLPDRSHSCQVKQKYIFLGFHVIESYGPISLDLMVPEKRLSMNNKIHKILLAFNWKGIGCIRFGWLQSDNSIHLIVKQRDRLWRSERLKSDLVPETAKHCLKAGEIRTQNGSYTHWRLRPGSGCVVVK